jgi:hypothetical protein
MLVAAFSFVAVGCGDGDGDGDDGNDTGTGGGSDFFADAVVGDPSKLEAQGSGAKGADGTVTLKSSPSSILFITLPATTDGTKKVTITYAVKIVKGASANAIVKLDGWSDDTVGGGTYPVFVTDKVGVLEITGAKTGSGITKIGLQCAEDKGDIEYQIKIISVTMS